MFFKRKTPKGPPQPTIQVFVRHCNYSSASAHKKRPEGFSREACHQNLLDTIDSRINLTYFLDTATPGDHFIKPHAIEIKEGTEAGSFLRMLDHVEKLNLHPDTIVYFLEDDYLHSPGWVDVLFEAFTLPTDYVTLYDHRDKYSSYTARDSKIGSGCVGQPLNLRPACIAKLSKFSCFGAGFAWLKFKAPPCHLPILESLSVYPHLKSQIFLTSLCHWRTTPSTTNTYAMRYSTLLEHLSIHRKFSLKRKITADHDKFCCLGRKGAMLISPIPGYSTHAEPEYFSPFFKETLCKHSH